MDTSEIQSNDKRSTTKKALPLHIEQKINLNTGTSNYYCTICQKSFQSRTQKYYHYGCSDKELKKHKCDLCGKCFATRSHLNYHQETHNSMVYHCQECRKVFSNRIVLQKHFKIHQRTATYPCTYCSKEFKNKESLTAHIARHNNELNFECNVCSTKYATKSALEQHRLSHVAKRHECSECGKRFQRNSILSLHLKRHEKTDPHTCTMCSKKFKDITTLQRHMKLHEIDNIVKYRCIQCDITSARKDNMQRHLRNMHAGEKFSDCIEILKPTEKEQLTSKNNEHSSLAMNFNTNERFLPKTVANSTVIKCVGNVEPVKVPNILVESSSELIDQIYTPVLVKEATIRPKKVKKKYDPIEMYRKIIGTEDDDDNEDVEQTETFTDERADTAEIIEKPRSTALNISNFSETHWRKNFKYTYQHQEY